MSNTKDENKNSFLDQTQIEGKAVGEVKMNLDQALQEMSKILSSQEKAAFNEKGDDWEPIRFAVYCHDCHSIVPPGVGRGNRGKMRTVCGACNSRKISTGREEALRKFYNIEDKPAAEPGQKVEKKYNRAPRPKKRRPERKKKA